MTEIEIAVLLNDHEKIEELSLRGLGVNSLDHTGQSPLMYAVLNPQSTIETIRLLLELGADVNYQEPGQGYSALHFASRDKKTEAVLLLLRNGASVHQEDAFGNTPLWRAVMTRYPVEAIVLALLDAGSNPQKKNKNGASPLDVAEESDEAWVAKLLSTYLAKGTAS